MYRFLLRPKWIGFHLLVVAAIVTMVNLGFWQLRRLDERQAFNAVGRGSATTPRRCRSTSRSFPAPTRTTSSGDR